MDLTYIYTVTFTGDGVTGDVPELVVDSTFGEFPPAATQATRGNEVVFDPASQFGITHTCESYSDPYAISTFSAACTPSIAAQLCASCITRFDGTVFTIATGTTLAATVAINDRLIAGICVFTVGAVSATSLTVLANDVGLLCSTFTGATLPLFRAVQPTTMIPVKTASNTISAGSVVENLLNTIIDSVTVVRTQSITATFVGSLYEVTFRKRSGRVPLLRCDASTIQRTNTNGAAVCTPIATTTGSMIGGKFTISLAKESDGVVVTTPDIPWDASESLMKSTLEGEVVGGERVFGTVNVRRSVFSPTGNKWSGGFTWQIEFTSRGWDIPKMTVTNALVNSDNTKLQPDLLVEDATSPFNPFAGSRDGNQIAGSITFAFGVVTSQPCMIGVHTDITNLQASKTDAILAAFLVAQLGIPTIQVTRSAATQARGFTWAITFSDPATGGDVAMLDIPATLLTGQNVRTRMFETVKGNQLGGTFQLKFNGETSGPILFSADNLAVQAQLNSLASIKPSSVLVSRTGPAISSTTQVLSYTWSITFRSSVWADPTSDHSNGIAGNWKGPRAKWDDVWPETGYSKAWGRHVGPMASKGFQVMCIKDGLTTTANDNSQNCQSAVATAGVGPILGTFTVTLNSAVAGFMSVKKTVVSTPIAHNAWATRAESGATGTSVEEILEEMENIGDVAVSRSAVNTQTGGYTWTVTFLRDANGPCEQEEPSTSGVRLCNSPGDVPAMTASLGSLAGSTPTVTVCEKTLNNCLQGAVQNGRILRGDFTTFKATGDPGFDQRYFVTIACAGGAAPPCDPIQFFNIALGSEDLPDHLKTKDRFTIDGYPTCIYTVVRVTATQVEVNPSVSCPAMVAGMANNPVSVFIRVPWNADESLVKRVLEASSDQNNEMVDPWKGGRKVSVVRTIFGKYGEVSWQVRFISNPTFTPPGAGNIRDITTVFAPNPTTPDLVSVTQVTPGSAGLSGSFLVDFHSTFGPREIMFDESEDRLQRKLNEMNTIGRVIVKKFQYPSTTTGCTDSSCSGGWEDQPVGVPGTRGGYRWRVRFMKVTGEYGGLTFPAGSGNVGPLAVTLGTLQGNQRAIDLTTNLGGSSPILGGFTLNTSTKATPSLPYSASADSIKQGIESMNLFGEVDVTQEYLLMQRIPNAVATISKDGITATVAGVDDIRQSLALGDRVRFGPSSAANLVGTNGDSPITGVIATSTVTVLAMSPNVRADPTATRLLFPKMNVRIDGLAYQIQRSGHEIQTVAVTLPIGSWDPNEARTYFNLKLKRGGSSQTTTACWPFDIDAATVQRDLNALLVLLIPTAQANEIKVTRSGPMSTEANARKGYVFSVYFLGPSVAGNVAILEADFTGCTAITGAQVAIAVTTQGGKIGHQRLSFATDSGQVVDPTGYFKLSLGGASTGCLKWGISASDLEAQLEGTLNTGNVLVARRGSGASVTEVQRLRMTSNSQVTTTNTGLFQLAFTVGGKTSWTTGCLAYGISAEELQVAINQMSNIAAAVSHVAVTRDGDGTSVWGYGYEYTINFRGPIAGGYSNLLGNVAQLEVFNVGSSPCAPVVGGAPALIMETVRDGGPGYTYDIYFLNYAAAYTPQLSIQHEGNGGVCTTGWTHTGGSVREAIVDVVSLGGSSEVQTLVFKDSAAQIPAGSSYKLTFGGASTNCIVFDASASALETALAGLATIATGGVLVSRDQHPVTAPNGYIYAITFVGELTTGDVPLLATVLNDPLCQAFAVTTQVVVTEQVKGGAHPGGFVTTALYDGEQPGQHVAYAVSQVFSVLNEQIDIQQLLVTNPQSDLTVNSVYKLVVLGVTTVSIRWDASEDDMETALTVAGVNDGDIVVTRRKDAALAPNGYVYTIYFSGNTVKGIVAAITVNTKTSFGSGDVLVSTVQNGVDNAPSFLTTSIPLALPSDSSTSSAYLGMDASLNVFKVNGFLWTIKFKSTIGNIPALGMRSDGLSGTFTVLDDFVPGSSSNSYVMSSLYPGINYFVRVAASTDIGTGPLTDPASKIPSGVATAVQNLAAVYALYVREVQEIRVAATHINEIQEIKTSAATMAEVQTVRTYASADACTDGNCIGGLFAFRVPTVQTIKVSAQGPITAGSYSIRFVRYKSNGAGAFVADGTVFDTVKISWDASADDVKMAMAALDSVDASDLIVTRDGDGSSAFGYGYILSITFIGNKVAGETDKITIKDSTSGCGTCDPFVTTGNVPYAITVSINSGQAMGTDTAVQEVIVKASKPVVSGSYRLEFTNLGAPVQSACINFDAPARGTDVRAMEGILIAMSNIDVVYVTRDLDPVRAPNGFVYQVFFYGNGVYGPMITMEVVMCEAFKTQENNVLTTNGVNGLVTVTTIDTGGITAGNTFVDAASATADQLEADLNRLPVFGDVIVTRSLVDQQGGFVWTVAFKDSEGNLPQFICAVDATFAGRTGTACETTTLTDGNALSGTFVVESSVPIAFDASAATMKAALEAMSWIGTVQVVRAGPTPQMGFTWTITFLDYMGDVPPLLITSSLVGTGSAIQVTEITKGNFIGGTFTLTYLSSTTAPIASNAKATAQDSNSDGTSLQEKLQALSTIGPTSVTRSAMDPDGGYTWLVSFLDNNLNPGDVPLLVGNATLLTGVGVVVATREIQKGSNAVGDQLWISFDPPVSDQGSPISKYVVRWDTSALFTASPSEVSITEPEKLYLVQRVMTGAPSLGWSRLKATEVAEVQTVTIANGVANGATFMLSFRGVASATLTAGVSTAADLLAALSGISTIGTVTVTPTTGLVAANAVFQVTFVDKPGDLPFLSSTPAATATITETTKGVANYRKEVIVFSCLATTGTVTFQYGAATQAIAFDATLVITKTHLETLFNVEAGGIRVLSSQSLLCAPAGPADVTIVFDRVYGDITLQITSATVGTTITRNTIASIDGIYNDVAAKMSGTFQVGYKGEYTRALNAESSALDMRYALEDLITIDTVAVSREASYQALPGTVDVVNGQIFVTCSIGQTCGFLRSAYGLPGYHIRIGGTWYRVRTSPTTQDSLDATRLYLGDTNGREIGYQGETRMGVTVYEWTKGYVWAVYMLRVAQPLAYLRAKIPRLVPSDSTVMIAGSACDKCYYLPTQTTKRLTMGQEYFIDITAYNENGKGQLPVNGPIRATPSQVPNAPSNVDFVVVSGKELEVFFSPPALASTNVSPNFNNDISSYIVQWDLRNDFKHGLPVCTACATALQVNALTVSQSLVTLLAVNSKFTIAAENCVLTVAAITATRIDVSPNHGCSQFNTGAYPLYYYTYPPAILTGDQIQGSPPFRYLISNLVVSTQYYVRVAAVNSVPVQQIALSGNPPDNRKWSFPLAATTKDTVPDPPVSVYLYPFSGTTLEIQIQPPTRDGQGLGGAAITFYWVDIDTVSTFDSATKAAPVEVGVSGPDIPVLYAGGPRVYYSKNLQTGVRYFVQVKAKNSIGYSRATIAPNPLAPTQSPDGPVNVKVATVLTSPTPIDYATVTWQKPLTDGGLPVTSYKIEWWGADSRPEIQVIEIKWTTIPTTAPFKLAFGGLQTGNMPFDVAPENLRSALMNLGPTKIQHVQVTRSTVNINKGYQWRVTFQNNLNTGDQPMIQLEFGTIVGGTDVTGRVFEAQFGIAAPQLNFPGKREVQVLLTSHATTTVGGYFRLSYKGSAWSNYLSATIAGADLKLALEALPTVGKVTVTSQGASTNGQIWTITFESAVGNLPTLIVDSSKLTPAGAFIGVKDGDNAVDKTGARCVPGDDICPGSWSTYKTGIAAMATIGESAVAYQFYETIDATTLSYKVTGLVPGKTYYVAVTAKNALGLGSRIRSTPTTIIPPVQAPSPPSLVTVDVNPGVATQLKVTWSAPPSDGGGEVRMYRVEYDPSPLFRNRGYQDFWCPTAPTYAVWTVQTYRQGNTGKPIGNGYFNLLLTRQNLVLQTEPIPWNAVATSAEEVGDNAPALSKVFCVDCPGCTDVCQSQPAFSFGRRELSGSLQSKLEYLSTVNQVQIVRSAVAADGGYTWTITFQDVGDDFVLAPFIPGAPTLTCDDNVCNGGGYRIQTTKITNGISNPPCTGSQIIPANGALNKGQLYYVRVFSFNKIGFSLPGLAASPQKPMVVPGPPTGVTLQVLTVSELKVLFSPPDDDGGDTVVEYLVEWATNNAFTNAQSGSVVLLSGGAPYYRVISNLVKGTFYYVRVKAKNSQGYGQYQISSPTSLNPYTTPSAPTQVLMGVTSSTMLTVQWSIPDDDGGDAISGYLVQWDISAGFDSLSAEATKAKITDVTQRSYTITLLTPGTTYYVRVSAINSGGAGTSQTTTPASLVPVNTRPGKPHSLQAAPTANARELLVTWQQPRIPAHGIPCSGTQLVPLSCPIFVGLDVVYGGSSLESYLVQYSDNSDFTGFNWLGVATTSALLQGLDSGKLYYVRVLTINSEGQKSDFCGRANSGGYLCPDNLVLLDGNIVTGTLVAATPA
ncbi:hypothetical protein Poli38472_003030 [Pythium oligandrum]|uniref:Fibronectin type-III domain-containing protein n=1 Tax=Pythium oligandrum TaxID=41045 RepID=A0A8K1FBC1_PYTOL|nr:hypothetical protein Poli38472_003030 [Pythium oligandrum]|eukprot:TMW57105.1 hypothetical protein Poli38472_003030 [Pythium oligandrum]